jgi:hypothetical protein
VKYSWVSEPLDTDFAWAQFKLAVATGRQYENSDVPSGPVAVAVMTLGSTGLALMLLSSKLARPLPSVVVVNEPR